MSGRASPLFRLAAGGAVVLVTLIALWQAGLLFSTETTESEGPPGLANADASVQTPPHLGLQVGLRPGDLAPNFEFSDFEGHRLRLSDFRGRPVAVNFWASWCGPCKAEMPALEDAERRYQARSFAVIGVNNGETYRAGQRFLDEVGVDLTAFAFDPEGVIARRYAVQGMPTTYFLDADGVVTRVVAGVLTERILTSAIDEAIIGWGRAEAR